MVDTQPSEIRQWIAETKFHPPVLRDDNIPRPNLINHLYNMLELQPFTLLSTPAGYGKTTLLATLYTSYPGLSLAWLSLDEEDNDPARFLTAFIGTLDRIQPACCATSHSVLSSLHNPGAEVRRVMSVLINDVLDTITDPYTVILDDLHLITEPAIYAGLDYLLDNVPPQMHLVVSSRTDPPLSLARLRARGHLAELRLDKLRFTDAETIDFLNDRLNLDLLPAEVEILQSRTEGWAAGLRLLAGSLDRISSPEDRTAFIHQLAQMDHFIFDFLAEEVFNHQEPEVQEFLLKTAILSELTPALCQTLTDRSDAGIILEDLYRRNLFLFRTKGASVDESNSDLKFHLPSHQAQQPSYRYHDLFFEFLQHKLQQERPDWVDDLHLRAAQAQKDKAQAVVHYLAAEAWSEAAEIIEQIGAEMFARGYLDTLSNWINTLPASIRESHPRLLHYLSSCALWKGAWQEMQSLLERALSGFEQIGDEIGQGEVLADLATCSIFQGDFERSVELFERALVYDIPLHTRVHALLGRAAINIDWGDWAQAERDFKTAMNILQQTGELDLIHLVNFPFFDPGFAFLPGGMQHLERICRQARDLVGDEVSPLRLVIEELAATLKLFRGQLDDVIQSAKRAQGLRTRLGGHPFMGIEADFMFILAHAIQGNYALVDPLLDDLFQESELTYSPTDDLADILYMVGRIRWMQGRLEESKEIYERLCTIKDPRRDLPAARICRVWMWSLLEVAAGRYSEAERALCDPEVLYQSDRRSTICGSTRLMLARLYLMMNRHQEALVELDPVLEYHQKLGLPYPILLEGQSIVPLLRLAVEQGVHENYAAHLLELMGVNNEPRPVYVSQTGATLTPREVEILQLVVTGNSNQAIADQLFLSVWTIKSHLTKIYRKLDVTSRTQAGARARELGLG